jgi:hypothetical protein
MSLPALIVVSALVSGAPAADAASPVKSTRIAGMKGGPVIGLADNSVFTLLDRRFRASGIKRVRVQFPIDDVVRGGKRRAWMDIWFDKARRAGVEPLVTFNHAARSKRILPSVSQYRRYFRAFRLRYPWVRHFSTWNEANFPDAQPTGNNPRRTAAFYKAARRECSGGRCTVLTADFRADGGRHSAWWLRTFRRAIGGGSHHWGLVSHPDINRYTTARTRAFLRATRGPVWATETGAVNFFGRGFRPDIGRQNRAMRYMMRTYPRVSRRLQRMYVYHWRAAKGNRLFDSALLNVNGSRRPAYFTFFRALGKRAP